MNNMIETFGLSKAFRIFRQTEALHAMDLAVPEGSVYGLVQHPAARIRLRQ